MANFLLRNPLNPSKVVSVGITYKQVVDASRRPAVVDRDHLSKREGELVWVVEIATNETTVSGLPISPEIIHLTNLESLDDEIKKAVERISKQINWEPLSPDTRPPIVEEVFPSNYVAPIQSDVRIKLIDLPPAAGIDLNSIQLFINDIDVTSEMLIEGNEYECVVYWRPTVIVYDTY